MTDALGRFDVTEADKQRIHNALNLIPDGKRAAVIVIADTETQTVRGQLAARLNGTWKVAAGAGWVIGEKRPGGWIAVEGAW